MSRRTQQDDDVTPPRPASYHVAASWSDARDPDEDGCRRFSQTGFNLVWNALEERCSSYDPGLSGLTSALADGVLAGEPPPPRSDAAIPTQVSYPSAPATSGGFSHYEQKDS